MKPLLGLNLQLGTLHAVETVSVLDFLFFLTDSYFLLGLHLCMLLIDHICKRLVAEQPQGLLQFSHGMWGQLHSVSLQHTAKGVHLRSLTAAFWVLHLDCRVGFPFH